MTMSPRSPTRASERPSTRAEAVWVSTLGGARLAHQEDKKGSLEPGKHADFAVYDVDPLVRIAAAERLAPAQLVALVGDPDLRVRWIVAERGDVAALPRLCNDPDPEVSARARARLAALEPRSCEENDDAP